MTQEFDHVRASFAVSMPGRMLSGVRRIIESAWHTSSFGSAMRRTGGRRPGMIDLIRTIAIAIAIAALLQPLLMAMMSRTLRPSMPLFVFVAIALIAAAAAWRPGAVALAWPQSRLTRWLRR
jgi:hypothetical protein